MADREEFIQSAAIAAALRQGVPTVEKKQAMAIAADACDQSEGLWERYATRKKTRRAQLRMR